MPVGDQSAAPDLSSAKFNQNVNIARVACAIAQWQAVGKLHQSVNRLSFIRGTYAAAAHKCVSVGQRT
jgi:hypothetical protein